ALADSARRRGCQGVRRRQLCGTGHATRAGSRACPVRVLTSLFSVLQRWMCPTMTPTVASTSPRPTFPLCTCLARVCEGALRTTYPTIRLESEHRPSTCSADRRPLLQATEPHRVLAKAAAVGDLTAILTATSRDSIVTSQDHGEHSTLKSCGRNMPTDGMRQSAASLYFSGCRSFSQTSPAVECEA